MTKRREHKRSRKTPFKIGMRADHCIPIIRRTGRDSTPKILTVITKDGQEIDLSNLPVEARKVRLEGLKVQRLVVEWWLSSGEILLFKVSRLPDRTGPNCYRIQEVRWQE